MRAPRFLAAGCLAALSLSAGALAQAGDLAPAIREPVPPARDPVLVAAGDVACDPRDGNFRGGQGTPDACRMAATADLLARLAPDVVAALGDLQYEHGAAGAWPTSFGRTWGRVKGRIRPAPGNHEYETNGAWPYFEYFGAAAGPAGRGWYSYDLGRWHIVSLNSNCGATGCGWESAQARWLQADLAAHPAACTLAYWHHPRFSSGPHGNEWAMDALWTILYWAGADVVLSGHDHDYERFARLGPEGRPDPQGIRQFVVGTGGKTHYRFKRPQPGSEVRDDRTFGVLRLPLRPASYDWEFVPEAGRSFSDRGHQQCHGRPAPR